MFLRRFTTASPPVFTPPAAAAAAAASSAPAGKSPRPSTFETVNQKLRDSLAKNMKIESITSTQNDVMHVLFSGRNLIVKADKSLQKSLALGYVCFIFLLSLSFPTTNRRVFLGTTGTQ